MVYTFWPPEKSNSSAGGTPAATTFYRVFNGVFEKDNEGNAAYWRSEIARLNGVIEQERPKEGDAEDVSSRKDKFQMGSPLLRAVLAKYLNQRLLEGHEKAWVELQRELRHRDQNYFHFHPFEPRQAVTAKCRIEEIETPLIEILRSKRYLPGGS